MSVYPSDIHPSSTDFLLVMTTVAEQDDARRIGAELLTRRLVACVQISPIESLYRWQGSIQNEVEWRLVLKTTSERYESLVQALRELHAYELPAIYAIPVTEAFEPYATWVREETR